MCKLFVNALIRGEFWPALNHAAGICTWDSSKKTFITPEYDEREWQLMLDDAAWYKDEYGARMSTKGKQKKN